MPDIIPGILISGKADCAEPDARTEPPTATARSGALCKIPLALCAR